MSRINDTILEAFLRAAFRDAPRCRRLLDLGCGTQPYAGIYRDKADMVVAADYTVRSAVTVRVTASALPFAAEVFDTIVFSEVLEHLSAPEAAMEEIARVLRPGGRLILTVPFNYMQHEIPDDYTRYTQFGLLHLLSRCDLDVEQMYQRGGTITVLTAVLEFLVSGFVIAVSRVPILGGVVRCISRAFGRFWKRTVEILFRRRWGKYPCGNGRSRSVEYLRGARGQLRLWTLGYCVIAVKRQ